MNFVRSLIHMVWMMVSVIPWALVVLLISPFSKPNTVYWACTGWLKNAMASLRLICGVDWRVHGMENLPQGRDEGAILLVKHQSTFETFLMPALMPHPLAYVFKKELLYIPFFGWAMGRMDMIHIDRSKKAEAFNKVVAQGKRLLARGVWVIMFPEGTRIPRGQTGQYKSGGTRLAVATGAPVIPIAVSSARAWPRKGFVKRPVCIDVIIGPQIPSVGKDPEVLIREVQAWIEARMREIDPEAYPASTASVSDPQAAQA
jgi:1-acyl-sn-glycerol-3-phosphate acyltransferase